MQGVQKWGQKTACSCKGCINEAGTCQIQKKWGWSPAYAVEIRGIEKSMCLAGAEYVYTWER